MKDFELNDEQAAAVTAMQLFLQEPALKDSFFLLAGAAGTGKTSCIRKLALAIKGRLIFTAPTNKATKVIMQSFSGGGLGEDFEPECRTIYSLLGLRLEANGAVKELTHPEDPVSLSRYLAVIVDEASMINSNLWKYIRKVATTQKTKFIFLGDAMQLPPVGEARSPVWDEVTNCAELFRIMRHDNQILALATHIREKVTHPAPKLLLDDNHAEQEGVWKVKMPVFLSIITGCAEAGEFQQPNCAKAVAWRNVTVDRLNRLIRQTLFQNWQEDFLPSDRIIILEPVKGFEDGNIKATTDSEGTIQRQTVAPHPLHPEFDCYQIVVQMDDGGSLTLWGLHPKAVNLYTKRLAELSAMAKANPRNWKDFWAFREAFHQFRYGYAITVHRAQGSTYTKVFVDVGDILLNRNGQESLQCLYVACTRPKKQLILTV